MQDFGTKADNSPPPGGQLSAAEFNNFITENENSVLRSGQALNGASVTQLAQSLFLHGVKSETFQDSGAANAYVATPISGTNGVLLPPDYVNMAGAVISFKASNSNTTAATLNIGQATGALLGAKFIRTQGDTALLGGSIVAGQYIQVAYNPAFDSGNGAWELLPWTNPETSQGPGALNLKMSINVASASASATADTVLVSATLGGKSYLIPAFNKTVNLATTGAGGMDTGTAPVNGYVALYAIYNPVTGVSALLGVNATASAAPNIYGGANMPAGFTASSLLTVLATNASSLFKIAIVRGRSVGIVAAGAFSTAIAVSNSVVSIATVVPPNAIDISGYMQLSASTSSNLGMAVVSDTNQISQQNLSLSNMVAGQSILSNMSNVMLSTPQQIVVTTTVTAGTPSLVAFISEYKI